MSYAPKPAAKTAQISCVNKVDRPSPWERILSVGGTGNGGWKISQTDAINKIENGEWGFYVSVGGKSVWVIVGMMRRWAGVDCGLLGFVGSRGWVQIV